MQLPLLGTAGLLHPIHGERELLTDSKVSCDIGVSPMFQYVTKDGVATRAT
jgi:hypothetical protein